MTHDVIRPHFFPMVSFFRFTKKSKKSGRVILQESLKPRILQLLKETIH